MVLGLGLLFSVDHSAQHSRSGLRWLLCGPGPCLPPIGECYKSHCSQVPPKIMRGSEKAESLLKKLKLCKIEEEWKVLNLVPQVKISKQELSMNWSEPRMLQGNGVEGTTLPSSPHHHRHSYPPPGWVTLALFSKPVLLQLKTHLTTALLCS